jgi:glycosyltransferase involved in cell wall biosynthesis
MRARGRDRINESPAARRLRIAQVSPLYERVPPLRYGGSERVVAWLTNELVRRGHDVTVFASGDSETPARLIAPTPRALRLDPAATDDLSPHVIELAQVFQRAADFDVIHCHVDYLAFPFGRLVRTPTLHTLHGRLDLPFLAPVFRYFGDVPVVSISEAQRGPLRDIEVAWAATVHHGLSVEGYPFVAAGGRYLAFLGRICPEKGVDVAIEVAKRTGVPLKIAAKIDPVDRAYFEQVIRPLLDHPLIEFVGEVVDADKVGFLGEALALLFPIDWPEPFGLVMIESLACGTPVIARERGSVPEILVHGRTGFVADTVDELVNAVKRIDIIDRADCRRHVETRFTAARMADDYEEIYRRLLAGPRAA